MKPNLTNIDKQLKKPLISKDIWKGLTVGVCFTLLLFAGFTLFKSDSNTSNDIIYKSILDINFIEEDYKFKFSRVNHIFTISINDNNDCLELNKSTGTSMYPYSKDKGSWAITDTCVNPQTLEVNDVIVFARGETRIQHRIIEIDYENEIIVTQGDNNLVPDTPISFEQLRGKLIGRFNATHSKEDNLSMDKLWDEFLIEPNSKISYDDLLDFNTTTSFHLMFLHNNGIEILIDNEQGWLVALNNEYDLTTDFDWENTKPFWIPRKFFDLNYYDENKLKFIRKDKVQA